MKSHGEMEQKDKQNNCKKSDFVKSMIAKLMIWKVLEVSKRNNFAGRLGK